MATDPRKLASNDKYLQKLDRLTFRIRKDGGDQLTKADIEQAAEKAGESVNVYVVGAIKARMEGGTVPPAQMEQQPEQQDTPQASKAAQDSLKAPQGVQLPSDSLKSAQRAAEAQGKPVADWIAHAIDAQAEREERMGKLSQAVRENQAKHEKSPGQ
jgi:predicted HicB family RNase H-like nuclease